MSFENTNTLTTSVLESRPGCIKAALHILGDKWSPLLLGQLVDSGKTFSDLELSLQGVSPRTLSNRLEKLLEHDILSKKLYNSHPPRYRYELTQKGVELLEILRAMSNWGNKYHQ